MNSKELEDNIKFAGGLVYCGQTTGVSSVGTRIQTQEFRAALQVGLQGCTTLITGCSSPLFGIREMHATVHQTPPHNSAPQVFLSPPV